MTDPSQKLYRYKFDLQDHLEHIKSFNIENPGESDELLAAMDRLAEFLTDIKGICK
jgi:hypothetical protein